MDYEELCARLFSLADAGYRAFHQKLLKNDTVNVIGVRIPVLRTIAREYRGREALLFSFADTYYEVTALKCLCACRLSFAQFTGVADDLVGRLDNWATCDMLAPACIARERAAFRPYICRYLSDGRTFVRRFALTTLLHFYVTREELPFVLDCLRRADTGEYYVSMAAAWLTAEVLIKFFEEGAAFLRSGALSRDTFLRSVRKACESFRLSDAQKALLRAMRADCHANA